MVEGGGSGGGRDRGGSEKKGREEARHGTGPVPEVQGRKGGGVGGTGEYMGSGVGGASAGGTEVVLGSANPLKERVEGRAEPQMQL